MKYALVTASTRGIGKEIGIELLKKDYYVYFNYCNDDVAALKLCDEIKEYINNYSIIKADLSTMEGLNLLYSEVREKLDCIVLNVGITDYSSFQDITFENWTNVINTNLNLPFFLIQKFFSLINPNSRIIFIGAMLGEVPHATSISYGVSKAGLHMLAKSLVKIFKSSQTTVNVIAPGFIITDWHEGKTPQHKQYIESKIALGYFGATSNIAQACLAIIENEYINGAIIDVNGGYDME